MLLYPITRLPDVTTACLIVGAQVRLYSLTKAYNLHPTTYTQQPAPYTYTPLTRLPDVTTASLIDGAQVHLNRSRRFRYRVE